MKQHKLPYRAALALTVFLAACSTEQATELQGYVEGEYLLMASEESGVVERLHVQRGQSVSASTALFELDGTRERAAVEEAAGRLRSAQARAHNLEAPRRPREIEALRAQLAQAGAAHEFAQQELRRALALQPGGAMSRSELDTARRNADQHAARAQELETMLALARLSIGRDPERLAAQADIEAAQAVLQQAEWKLAQRRVAAPAGGQVQDTYFKAGERVGAGRPVLSLLPPENIKLRFFVPETLLGAVKVGGHAQVRCDACGAPIAATISHVATQAEYTPPVLYSRSSRAKLVYLVEARPATVVDATRLHPGQPVDVMVARP